MRRTELALLAAIALVVPAAAPVGALAQDATSSQGFKLGGDEPIEVESDRLEVRDRENLAIFSGNVQLVQGKLLLKTTKMTVYYADASDGARPASTGTTAAGAQIDHMEAEGKVYIKQGDQVATGDQGTFDMASGVMVLTGKEVVLTQGENVVVGCRLVSNTKSGESKLDGCGRGTEGGRVKMLLQPGSKSN